MKYVTLYINIMLSSITIVLHLDYFLVMNMATKFTPTHVVSKQVYITGDT